MNQQQVQQFIQQLNNIKTTGQIPQNVKTQLQNFAQQLKQSSNQIDPDIQSKLTTVLNDIKQNPQIESDAKKIIDNLKQSLDQSQGSQFKGQGLGQGTQYTQGNKFSGQGSQYQAGTTSGTTKPKAGRGRPKGKTS